jgi:hypothetical protein
MSLRDQILKAEDIPHEDVEVPEWGVTVRVQGLTGTERDAYEAKMIALKQGGQDIELRLSDFRSKLVVRCLVDPETGERVFGDKDVAKLGGKSAQVILRLFDVARQLSGLTERAVEEAKGN